MGAGKSKAPAPPPPAEKKPQITDQGKPADEGKAVVGAAREERVAAKALLGGGQPSPQQQKGLLG